MLTIDVQTGFIKQLSYGYDKGPVRQKIWVETLFKAVSDKPKFDEKIFEEKHYLKKQGNSYIALGKYKGYKVKEQEARYLK